MTTKSAFPAPVVPMSPAWVHGSPHVEDLALPKSLKSCNLTLARAVIRWMSANREQSNGRYHRQSGLPSPDRGYNLQYGDGSRGQLSARHKAEGPRFTESQA